MGLFKGSGEQAPKLVPANASAAYFDLLGLQDILEPEARGIGLDGPPEWVTPEEAARREAAMPPPPPLEELQQDPNVAAVLEATGPHGEYLDLAAN